MLLTAKRLVRLTHFVMRRCCTFLRCVACRLAHAEGTHWSAEAVALQCCNTLCCETLSVVKRGQAPPGVCCRLAHTEVSLLTRSPQPCLRPRFDGDTSTMDSTLPASLDALLLSGSFLLASAVIIGTFLPILTPLALPLSVVLYLTQASFRCGLLAAAALRQLWFFVAHLVVLSLDIRCAAALCQCWVAMLGVVALMILTSSLLFGLLPDKGGR